MERKIYNIIITSTLIIGLLLLLTLANDTGALGHYGEDNFYFSYPLTWSIIPIDNNIFSVSGNLISSGEELFIDNENFIKFNYPLHWLTNQESFAGSEIKKHIRLVSPNEKNVCLIEIWEAYRPLTDFINDIKKAPITGEEVKYFLVKKELYNNYHGYTVTYKINNILCKEFYFTEDKKIYRIGYFYSGQKWSKEQENNFKTIVQSFQLLN